MCTAVAVAAAYVPQLVPDFIGLMLLCLTKMMWNDEAAGQKEAIESAKCVLA